MAEMDKSSCTYCHTLVTARHLLGHILSKHSEEFWTLNNKVLHSPYMMEPGQSQTGNLLENDCPPYLKIDKDSYQFCCLGCSNSVNKRAFAEKHFPKCLKAHLDKITKVRLAYPPLAPLAPLVPTLVNTVVQNQVVNVTNNTTVNHVIKFGDKMSLALSAAMYTCYKEEAKNASRASSKLQKVMEKFLKEIKPLATTQEGRNIMERFHDFLDEGYESTDSTASSVGEDPNEIKKEVEKEHEVKLPNIIKTKETDDFGDKKYIFKV